MSTAVLSNSVSSPAYPLDSSNTTDQLASSGKKRKMHMQEPAKIKGKIQFVPLTLGPMGQYKLF